jgi:hypothetical protein
MAKGKFREYLRLCEAFAEHGKYFAHTVGMYPYQQFVAHETNVFYSVAGPGFVGM